MEMHIVFGSTVKQKIYRKTFVIQHVISHLDTYLSTNPILSSM